MTKFLQDIHAGIGMAGIGAAYVIGHYNAIAGAVTVTATAVYMIYKALAERAKYLSHANNLCASELCRSKPNKPDPRLV